MADNPNINKVVYDGDVLIDLTSDTVDVGHLHSGYTAHDASGSLITGSYTPPVLTTGSATPSLAQQVVVPGEGYDAFESFTVNPIPSNYGRIAWDGSAITVY